MGDALIYTSFGAEFIGFAAVFTVRRPAPRAVVLTAITMLAMFLLDLIMTWFGKQGIDNLWIIHAGLPLITALILWSFSYFQAHNVARDAVRVGAVLYILVWLIMSAMVENLQHFSTFTAPIQSLVVLVAASYTLVSRVKKADTPLRSPWFWISIGWVLYFGSGVVLNPISQILLNAGLMGYLEMAYYVKAGINILAYALLTLGVLCGRSRPIFGGSFSQPPAPSRF